MRFSRLILGDITFQIRYGFYLLYAIFTGIYIVFLLVLPTNVRQIVATIIIFSDPAAIGIFFMGAIVLLEKSQRVDVSLAVSPIKKWEYIGAKVISLSTISCIVGIVISMIAGTQHIFIVLLGLVLSSILFSLCGLIIAMKVDTLNKFMIATVPFMIIITVPAVLYLFGVINSPWLIVHPGVATIEMINGNKDNSLYCIISLLSWSVLAFWCCHEAVKKSFNEMGGGKL